MGTVMPVSLSHFLCRSVVTVDVNVLLEQNLIPLRMFDRMLFGEKSWCLDLGSYLSKGRETILVERLTGDNIPFESRLSCEAICTFIFSVTPFH